MVIRPELSCVTNGNRDRKLQGAERSQMLTLSTMIRLQSSLAATLSKL